MPLDYVHAAAKWFGRHPDELGASERKALERAVQRRTLVENPNPKINPRTTLGERVADRVAKLGGSWTFIVMCLLFLMAWIVLNDTVPGVLAFDPYPFIFLNLMLSMVAALQAPIIMMSQNRQSAKDRLAADIDYQLNLKLETQLQDLHLKMDELIKQSASSTRSFPVSDEGPRRCNQLATLKGG